MVELQGIQPAGAADRRLKLSGAANLVFRGTTLLQANRSGRWMSSLGRKGELSMS